jgi:NADPH:quinone reductase-like Zn-dependent oxidoreductase
MGSEDVLVRVGAASVNPIDKFIAAGYLESMYNAPMTLGTDFAGEVTAVGDDVRRVSVGDAVYGLSLNRGTFAEYAVVNVDGVAQKPASLDDVDAAAVPLAGLSAWQTLFNLAKLQSGERILIHGAGGGIGQFAVQLAKGAGAYVIAHDKASKEDFVRQLGADEFIDASSERFDEVVGRVDVVLDLVGGDYVERSFALCEPGARYVTTAATLPEDAGKEQGIVALGTYTQPTVEELTKLTQEIDAGRPTVEVQRTFPLREAQSALTYRSPDSRPGKVVITLK